MAIPVIIDTDPGVDDAIALLLAWRSPELEIAGITTVAGNQSLEECYRNAHYLKDLADSDTPLFAGCSAPLNKPLVETEGVHGLYGLGGLVPNVKPPPSPQHSVDFMIEQCLISSSLTLCLLGPLTNLAKALTREPLIAEPIDKVIIMGGALDVSGNVTPYAEFNFLSDPLAAQIVFKSSLDIVLCPLDLTRQAKLSNEWIESLAFSDSDLAQYAAKIVATDLCDGVLHDPCVIAWLIKPDIFEARYCDVDIETEGKKEGHCLVEWSPEGKVTALMALNHSELFALLTERLT